MDEEPETKPGEDDSAPTAEAAEEAAPKAESAATPAEEVFLEGEGEEVQGKLKKKRKKKGAFGIILVQATFTETIVTVTDEDGNIIGRSSAGKMGFRGTERCSAHAAQLVSQDACRQAMAHGLKAAEIRERGAKGPACESAVRAVYDLGIRVSHIPFVPSNPHIDRSRRSRHRD